MQISSRPYLLRALYQWLLDYQLTPHIVVLSEAVRGSLPDTYTRQSEVVFNISPEAVRQLDMGNEYVCFSARFGGKPTQLNIPVDQVVAIYARENGAGMGFGTEPVLHLDAPVSGVDHLDADQSAGTEDKLKKTGKAAASHLTLIKS